MDDNYNIKDVLLSNNEDPKTTNLRKILMAIAALVVIFLIVLIIMKFINSGNIDTNKPLVMPKAQEEIKKIDDNLKELDDSIKPLNNEEKKESEQPIKESQENTTRVIQNNTVESKKEEVVNTPVVKSTQIEPKPVEPKKEETVKKEIKKEVKIIKPVEKKPIQKKKIETIKKDVKKYIKKPTKIHKKIATKKIAPKKEVIKQQPRLDLNSNLYIQVLATRDFKPSEKYIRELKEYKYSYALYKTKIKNVEYTKVLVGPFSPTNIQKELIKIRSNINKDAFIFRKK